MGAEELGEVIMLRHGSTGLKFELNGKDEDDLGNLKMARLFSRHFEYSGGSVGPALRSWITHIRTKAANAPLQLDMPNGAAWELLDDLRAPHKALLLQLVLHKALRRDQLARVSALDEGALKRDIDTLIRMGLLVESQQHDLSINPFVDHHVVDRLVQKGLLS